MYNVQCIYAPYNASVPSSEGDFNVKMQIGGQKLKKEMQF